MYNKVLHIFYYFQLYNLYLYTYILIIRIDGIQILVLEVIKPNANAT